MTRESQALEIRVLHMGKDQGWILLHRRCYDNFLYQTNKPKTRREAWEDMLLHVNYKPSTYRTANNTYHLKAGEKAWSKGSWSKLFNWDRCKTRRFFILLEKHEMIVAKDVGETTILTICNYKQYQTGRPPNDHQTTTEEISKEENNSIYAEIIGYLNETIKSGYKHTTKHTQGLINARTAEGFKVEDFKQVIGYKASQWISNPEMKKYLTPATLFSPSKFEKYLEESRSNDFSLSDDVTKIYNNCEPVRAIFFTKTHTRFVGENAQLYFTLFMICEGKIPHDLNDFRKRYNQAKENTLKCEPVLYENNGEQQIMECK